MKKYLSIILMLPLLIGISGCEEKEDLVFDHELPLFDIKENAILLEVIMPQGTIVDDEYYIVGAFNGGEEAIGNPDWKLEKAAQSNIKWGIYLYPNTFQGGKTPADGFTFHAKRQGAERSVDNQTVTHTYEGGVGTRTNIWVNRWEVYFGNVEKKNYTIYVDDQTGWDALALYAWGDDGDVTPSWPGMLPTGTETINGVVYTCFEMPEELKEVTMNLIFNNNNSGKQFDALQGFTLNRDLYLRITDGNYEEIDPNVAPYKGYTIYVIDETGWDALALYGWGADGDVTPSWPGLQPTGTKTINGANYTYFELGEELNGLVVNLIFNNNNNGKQFDALGGFTIDRDVYLRITEGGYEEIDPYAAPYKGYTVYVIDETGWDALALYAWSEGGDVTPGWPGLQPTGTKVINDVTYTYFELGEAANGLVANFIFNNNNGGKQFDALGGFTVNRDLYLRISDGTFEEVDPQNPNPGEESYTLYVDDHSGWEALAIYGWADGGDVTPGWPGLQPTGTKEIGGVNYTYFDLDKALTGKSMNVIFNNNNGGQQLDGPYITINRDYYFHITDNACIELTN